MLVCKFEIFSWFFDVGLYCLILPFYDYFCCISKVLDHWVFIIICFHVFSIFSLISWLTHSFCSGLFFNIPVFVVFPNVFLVFNFKFYSVFRKYAWYDLNLFLFFVFCFFTCWGLICDLICHIFWKLVPCELKKNVYSVALWRKVLNISVNSIWSSMSFKATVSLLIFCLYELSITLSGVLKSSTIILLL